LKIENLNKKDLNEYDPTKDKDVIIWEKSRKLSWEDFQGIPDSKNEYGALTESIGYQKADPVTRKNENQLEFSLGNIKTYALFRKSGSWVKKSVLESQNQELILEHEQGHFDISEIFRRRFEQELRKASLKIHLCKGKNPKEIQENADRKIEKILRKIGKVVNTKRDQYNEKYENETEHGIKTEIQKKYTTEIQTLLKDSKIT
jgi:hypothetical protein